MYNKQITLDLFFNKYFELYKFYLHYILYRFMKLKLIWKLQILYGMIHVWFILHSTINYSYINLWYKLVEHRLIVRVYSYHILHGCWQFSHRAFGFNCKWFMQTFVTKYKPEKKTAIIKWKTWVQKLNTMKFLR